MRDSIQKAVLLLISAHLPNQEDGIQDHASDDESEENNTQDERDDFAPVEYDPTDVEHQGHRGDKHAESDGERDGLFAAGDTHGTFQGRIALRKQKTARSAPSWGTTCRRKLIAAVGAHQLF